MFVDDGADTDTTWSSRRRHGGAPPLDALYVPIGLGSLTVEAEALAVTLDEVTALAAWMPCGGGTRSPWR